MSKEFIEAHLEKHAGPIVLRWENLIFARSSEQHHCHVAMTCGLSDTPMNAPKDEWKYLELCAFLPGDWPLEPQNWGEEHLWPLRGLETLARIPAQTDGWLGLGHTIPNGDPPRPFTDDVRMCAWWLLPPLELPAEFGRSLLPGGEVLNVLNLVPIFGGELEVKLKQGFPTLLDIFGKKGVSDVINPKRQPSTAGNNIGRWLRGR